MATPFGADGSLDLDASRALARHLVQAARGVPTISRSGSCASVSPSL